MPISRYRARYRYSGHMDLSWLNDLQPSDSSDLSTTARAGLSALRYLTDRPAYQHGGVIALLAREQGVDPSTIRRRIYRAKLELTRPDSRCIECDRPLPRGGRTSRRYCDEHATVQSRVRRHRLAGRAVS